jgi:hypothetical protein
MNLEKLLTNRTTKNIATYKISQEDKRKYEIIVHLNFENVLTAHVVILRG